MNTACLRCGASLSPDDAAFSCSYDCTFCAECTAALHETCPNCGGVLRSRSHTRTGPND